MRLGLVSATYPFGTKEPYLDTELRALAPSLGGIVVYPAAPQSTSRGFDDIPGEIVRLSLFAPATLALALRAAARHPRRAVAALAALLGDRYPARVKLKNLAVLPKGLALAAIAERMRLDHLHAYWLSTPATVAWIAARVARIPFSASAHRWDVYENNLAARKLRDARFVRTVSERGRRDLLALTGADPAKVHVVRLGVALPNAPRDASASSGGSEAMARPDAERMVVDEAGATRSGEAPPLRILCAAALVDVKDHRTLIAALAILRERGIAFRCTLAGAGPLREAIAQAIADAGLGERVVLAGQIRHDELLRRLDDGEFDAAVLTSAERGGGLMEGVPVALIEAMAAGCVVVATDSGSIGELVDAETGLLVPHSDPPAIADALARLAREPALRARLRAAASARVRERFDVQRTAAALRVLLAAAPR